MNKCMTATRFRVWKLPRPKAGFQKGGVPATPSGTATLLRLSPSRWFNPKCILNGIHLQVLPTPMA
jgi:hypothetical protein